MSSFFEHIAKRVSIPFVHICRPYFSFVLLPFFILSRPVRRSVYILLDLTYLVHWSHLELDRTMEKLAQPAGFFPLLRIAVVRYIFLNFWILRCTIALFYSHPSKEYNFLVLLEVRAPALLHLSSRLRYILHESTIHTSSSYLRIFNIRLQYSSPPIPVASTVRTCHCLSPTLPALYLCHVSSVA